MTITSSKAEKTPSVARIFHNEVRQSVNNTEDELFFSVFLPIQTTRIQKDATHEVTLSGLVLKMMK